MSSEQVITAYHDLYQVERSFRITYNPGDIDHRNTSNATPTVSFAPGHYPDLAQAREQLPKPAKLWDAVRHDFWTELLPHQRHSTMSNVNEQART
jgi:hypothetical protein